MSTIIFWIWKPGMAAAMAVIFLVYSLRGGRRQILVDNLPTSKTSGVFIGLVELKGKAEADPSLTSTFAGVPCAYFRYAVQEQTTTTEQQTSTDSDGKTQTRDVQSTKWVTVASDASESPFDLRDDRGVIRLLPKDATVEAESVVSRTCNREDPMYDLVPARAPPNSDHIRWITEEVIWVQSDVYVVGHARMRTDTVAAEIAADPNVPLFLISTKTESKVRSGYRIQFWGCGLLGLVSAAIARALFDHYMHPGAPLGLVEFAWAGAGYLAAWVIGWVWMFFNSLVDLRQRVRQAWANIDVELKRRAELLPNLTTLVTGQLQHERMVQPLIAALRAQGEATAPGLSGPDPAALATPLKLVAETYPELKAGEPFLLLQRQLGETEDRISLARNYFNDIATFYNRRLASFPDGLVARLGRMRPQPLMNAAGFDRLSIPTRLSSEVAAPTSKAA